ncbi:MAG: hypothetical protein AAF356_13360 [Planctomycetota bacterium]
MTYHRFCLTCNSGDPTHCRCPRCKRLIDPFTHGDVLIPEHYCPWCDAPLVHDLPWVRGYD